MKWIRGRWSGVRPYLPRIRDAVAVAIGLVVGLTQLHELRTNHPHDTAARVLALVGTLAAVALWWRRRHPLAITLLGFLVAAITGTEWILAAGLITLTIRRRDRVSWAVVGAAVLVDAATQYERGRHASWATALAAAAVFIALTAMLGAYIGLRREWATSLRERTARAEAEREMRAEQARLEERTRIAREMHDVLAHKVSLIALQAGGLEIAAASHPEQVQSIAAVIRQTAHQALEDLRDVLGVLRGSSTDGDSALTPQPRMVDVAELVESSRAAGTPITIIGSLDLAAPPEGLGRTGYRVVQEALTNVHKHARGARTELRLDGRPGDVLDIEVVNLRPVAVGTIMPGSGLGLVGLKERVVLAGGVLEIGSTAEGGFRVHARLPWPASLEAEVEVGS